MINKNNSDFEYDKNQFPGTPEQFKQLVIGQVETELNQGTVVSHRKHKKWWPVKVAAAVIVCAAVGTTGVYAGVKQYQAKSQEYLQKSGRISMADDTSTQLSASEENTSSIPAATPAPATVVSEETGLVTTFSDTWPDVMTNLFSNFTLKKQQKPYLNIIDAYYDGGILSIYGKATPYGLQTRGQWFLPDRVVINDTVFMADSQLENLSENDTDTTEDDGSFYITVEISDATLPDVCEIDVPLMAFEDSSDETETAYMQSISFSISGKTIRKPAVSAHTSNGATVTVDESKISASGTYLSFTWNFGNDKDSYDQFDHIISGDTIYNWIFCRITDSNGNTFDTQTDAKSFISSYWNANTPENEHWNDSGETAYIDEDGNYCVHSNILLPTLTQDFTSLQITPYKHLEDGTETDLAFASFQADYK